MARRAMQTTFLHLKTSFFVFFFFFFRTQFAPCSQPGFTAWCSILLTLLFPVWILSYKSTCSGRLKVTEHKAGAVKMCNKRHWSWQSTCKKLGKKLVHIWSIPSFFLNLIEIDVHIITVKISFSIWNLSRNFFSVWLFPKLNLTHEFPQFHSFEQEQLVIIIPGGHGTG